MSVSYCDVNESALKAFLLVSLLHCSSSAALQQWGTKSCNLLIFLTDSLASELMEDVMSDPTAECRGGLCRSLITQVLMHMMMWWSGEVRSALDACVNGEKHRIEASDVQLWSWFLMALSSVNMSNMNHNLSTNQTAEQHFCTFQELNYK